MGGFDNPRTIKPIRSRKTWTDNGTLLPLPDMQHRNCLQACFGTQVLQAVAGNLRIGETFKLL